MYSIAFNMQFEADKSRLIGENLLIDLVIWHPNELAQIFRTPPVFTLTLFI